MGENLLPKKLFRMVNEAKDDTIVKWPKNVDGFLLCQDGELSKIFQENGFRTRKFSSFHRNLNKYGFHIYEIPGEENADEETKERYTYFRHEDKLFKKDRSDLLGNIKLKENQGNKRRTSFKGALDGVDKRQRLDSQKGNVETNNIQRKQAIKRDTPFKKVSRHGEGDAAEWSNSNNGPWGLGFPMPGNVNSQQTPTAAGTSSKPQYSFPSTQMAPPFLSTHGELSARHRTTNAGVLLEVSGPRQSSTSYENEMVQNFGQSTAISLDVLNLLLSTPGPVVGGYGANQGVVSVLSSGRSGMQQGVNNGLIQVCEENNPAELANLKQLYGDVPDWCVNGPDLPDVYKVITGMVSMEGTDAIDTNRFLSILKESGLTQDLLDHILRVVNKACPGQLNVLELRLALGLVALAQAGVEKDRLNLQKLAAWKTILVPAFPENTMQLPVTAIGANGNEISDSGLSSGESLSERNQVPQQQRPVTITRGGGYPNTLSQNQVPEQEPPVTITPDRGPVECKHPHPFILTFNNSPFSELVYFLYVEFRRGETGKVVVASRRYGANDKWFGEVPTLGIVGTVDVIIRTPDEKPAGKTKYTYYTLEVEEVFMHLITSFQPPEGKSVGEQGVNLGREENSGENSATSSSFSGRFHHGGGTSSVTILRKLVNIAARVGAEQFLRITMSTSNARILYEANKNDSLFPEDIAAASGHDNIAAFLTAQTKRFYTENKTSQAQSKDVNWRELLEAIKDKVKSRLKEAKEKKMERDYIRESMKFGDIGDSSYSDQERNEGREEQKKSEVEGDESSETVYFGDDEDSSESDQERTEAALVNQQRTSWSKSECTPFDDVEVDGACCDSLQRLTAEINQVNIETFLKGREEVKKRKVEGDESSETVYFGDDEDSSESDQERTEDETLLSVKRLITPVFNNRAEKTSENSERNCHDSDDEFQAKVSRDNQDYESNIAEKMPHIKGEEKSEVEVVCKRNQWKAPLANKVGRSWYGNAYSSLLWMVARHKLLIELKIPQIMSGAVAINWMREWISRQNLLMLPTEDVHDAIQDNSCQDNQDYESNIAEKMPHIKGEEKSEVEVVCKRNQWKAPLANKVGRSWYENALLWMVTGHQTLSIELKIRQIISRAVAFNWRICSRKNLLMLPTEDVHDAIQDNSDQANEDKKQEQSTIVLEKKLSAGQANDDKKQVQRTNILEKTPPEGQEKTSYGSLGLSVLNKGETRLNLDANLKPVNTGRAEKSPDDPERSHYSNEDKKQEQRTIVLEKKLSAGQGKSYGSLGLSGLDRDETPLNLDDNLKPANIGRAEKSIDNSERGHYCEDQFQAKLSPDLVPSEIKARGPGAKRAYENALKTGKVKVYRSRIMLIGQDRAGKTSLKKSLLGLPFDPEEESTTGIEIDPSKFEINVDQVKNWKRTKEKFGVSQFAFDLAKIVAKKLQKDEEVEEREEEKYEKYKEGEEEGKNNWKPKQTKKDQGTPGKDKEGSKTAVANELKIGPSLPPEQFTEHLIQVLKNSNLQNDATAAEPQMTIELWDFAGQHLYRAIHPAFLSSRAVYLLVHDLSKELNKTAQPCVKQGSHKIPLTNAKGETNLEALCSWLASVRTVCSLKPEVDDSKKKKVDDLPYSRPPVIIVGTHADKTRYDIKEINKDIQQEISGKDYVHNVVRPIFSVDNTQGSSDEGVSALRKRIIDVLKQEPYMGEEIPVRWFHFEEVIKALIAKKVYFSNLEQLQGIIQKVCFIEEEDEVATLLDFYHDLGVIVKYRDTVVLQAQWLIDVFKQLITIRPFDEMEPKHSRLWKEMETTGVLSMALVDHVFSEYDQHGLVKEDILDMMEQFGLIVKFKSPTNVMYFVPCQVKTPPKPICEMEPSSLDPSPLYLHFPAGFVPHGFFWQLVSRCSIWCSQNGSTQPPRFYSAASHFFIDKEAIYQLVILCQKRFIKITLKQSQPGHVHSSSFTEAREAAVAVRTFLEETVQNLRRELPWLSNLTWDFCFACPRCQHNEGTCSIHCVVSCDHEDCLCLLKISHERQLSHCPNSLCVPTLNGLEKWFAVKDVRPGYHPGTDFAYNMTARPRGIALIINIFSFSDHLEMIRHGTGKDVSAVEMLFTALDFEVRKKENLSRLELLNELDYVACEDHSSYDCFVLWIMSHGKRNQFFCSDGNTISLQILHDLFSTCDTLSGKPKLFFIQACRGEEEDEGVPVATATRPYEQLVETEVALPSCSKKENELASNRAPIHADFLYAFSTVDGYVSYRHVTQGSHFVRFLVEAFRERAAYDDLLNMLTVVNHKVSNIDTNRPSTENENGLRTFKQMPEVQHTLRKEVRF